jgi:hypothetical protein
MSLHAGLVVVLPDTSPARCKIRAQLRPGAGLRMPGRKRRCSRRESHRERQSPCLRVNNTSCRSWMVRRCGRGNEKPAGSGTRKWRRASIRESECANLDATRRGAFRGGVRFSARQWAEVAARRESHSVTKQPIALVRCYLPCGERTNDPRAAMSAAVKTAGRSR